MPPAFTATEPLAIVRAVSVSVAPLSIVIAPKLPLTLVVPVLTSRAAVLVPELLTDKVPCVISVVPVMLPAFVMLVLLIVRPFISDSVLPPCTFIGRTPVMTVPAAGTTVVLLTISMCTGNVGAYTPVPEMFWVVPRVPFWP